MLLRLFGLLAQLCLETGVMLLRSSTCQQRVPRAPLARRKAFDEAVRNHLIRGNVNVTHIVRQFAAFSSIGVLAAMIHYGILIGFVEGDLAKPVVANLAGYTCGGALSYYLNRRCAFRSERAHRAALWRFAVVAATGFLLTGIFTYLFLEHLGLPYLIAAVLTSGFVLFWSFAANRLWTFRDLQKPSP